MTILRDPLRHTLIRGEVSGLIHRQDPFLHRNQQIFVVGGHLVGESVFHTYSATMKARTNARFIYWCSFVPFLTYLLFAVAPGGVSCRSRDAMLYALGGR